MAKLALSDLDRTVAALVKGPEMPRRVTTYGAEEFTNVVQGGLMNYLFAPLEIHEDVIPADHANRPGQKQTEIRYICIHDTGNTRKGADGRAHARYWNSPDCPTSVHYVVGNDGIYHLLPDDEWAHHAGDGTEEGSEFALLATKVPYTEENPVVTISDGEYVIHQLATGVRAPLRPDGTKATTQDIGDLGVHVEMNEDGNYAIGSTWWSKTYDRIGNHGGNRNSIGIETCVNEGSDLYLTWSLTAKLVARLMQEHQIALDHVVQHHFFSGKDCPMAMRHAHLWPLFKALVAGEYTVLTTLHDYTLALSCAAEEIDPSGRIVRCPADAETVNFIVTVRAKDGSFTKDYAFTRRLAPFGAVDLGLKI